MLRRVQWNFCESVGHLGIDADLCPDRVESEHIGHADQYRVTRDIPLPYTFDSGLLQDNTEDEVNHERSDAAGDLHPGSKES